MYLNLKSFLVKGNRRARAFDTKKYNARVRAKFFFFSHLGTFACVCRRARVCCVAFLSLSLSLSDVFLFLLFYFFDFSKRDVWTDFEIGELYRTNHQIKGGHPPPKSKALFDARYFRNDESSYRIGIGRSFPPSS